jgi:signal transduction histidine kinase
VFFVRDNGIGFPEGDTDRVFQPLQRVHAENISGVGMGLAIVRRIIRRHGGDIWAEGRQDEGATFHFTLGPPADGPLET